MAEDRGFDSTRRAAISHIRTETMTFETMTVAEAEIVAESWINTSRGGYRPSEVVRLLARAFRLTATEKSDLMEFFPLPEKTIVHRLGEPSTRI